MRGAEVVAVAHVPGETPTWEGVALRWDDDGSVNNVSAWELERPAAAAAPDGTGGSSASGGAGGKAKKGSSAKRKRDAAAAMGEFADVAAVPFAMPTLGAAEMAAARAVLDEQLIEASDNPMSLAHVFAEEVMNCPSLPPATCSKPNPGFTFRQTRWFGWTCDKPGVHTFRQPGVHFPTNAVV